MTQKNYQFLVILLITIIYLLAAAGDLHRPPADLHQFRQTQTLSTIYNFYISGINLFRPEIDTNGINSVVILEFPLFQGLSAFFMRIFGYYEAIPRIINITSTILSGLLLARISEQHVSRGSGYFVYLIFLSNPTSIFWSSTILIDPFALLLSIASVFFLIQSLTNGGALGFGFAVILGALAFTVKLTSAFIPFAIFYGFLLTKVNKGNITQIALMLLALIVMILAFLGWNWYSRINHEVNPHIYTNSSVDWYFGTMHQRFSPSIWSHFLQRFLNNHLAALAVVGFSVTAFFCWKKHKSPLILISVLSITSIFLYLFIFINLNFIHNYYQIPISAAIALIAGTGLGLSINTLFSEQSKLAYSVVLGSLCITLFLWSYNNLRNGSWTDVGTNFPYRLNTCEFNIGSQIKSYLDKEENLELGVVGLIFEPDVDCWNGPHALFYYLKQRGYLADTANWRNFRERVDSLLLVYKYNLEFRTPHGWSLMSTHKLQSPVNDYSFSIFTKHP